MNMTHSLPKRLVPLLKAYIFEKNECDFLEIGSFFSHSFLETNRQLSMMFNVNNYRMLDTILLFNSYLAV